MIAILLYHLIVLTQLFLVCRNKTVNIKEIVQVFLVGATAAVMGNFLVQGIAVQLWGRDLVLYTAGPVAEEVLKISFVIFLLFKTRMGKSLGIEDGLLLGAAAGAGYGFSEDSVRAIGLGFREMTEYFPGYSFSNIGSLLTTWLPTERENYAVINRYNIFVAGHLLWTALAGAGFAIALKIPSRHKWRFIIPLALFVWVIVDHSLVNNSRSALSVIHSWYGFGQGIKYVLTALIIVAIVWDELTLKRNLISDKRLFLPGEKGRSMLGELWLTLTSWKFGRKYWLGVVDYLRLRRQLGFLAYSGEKTDQLTELLISRRRVVIASYKSLNIPPGVSCLWQGPPRRNMWLGFVLILVVMSLFNAWLFLFSVYFPQPFVRAILRSPVLPIFGVIGYVTAVFEIFVYYKKKLWRVSSANSDDRVTQYSHPIFINTSGITILFSLPFFARQHPLLVDKFLWGQLARFFEFLKESRKWVGGPVSAGIGAIPIVGNVQSGVNAAFGYDYLADEPVEGFDRFMAAVGAVPLAGNALRSGWWAAKSARYARVGKAVNRLKKPIEAIEEIGEKTSDAIDKIEKAQAVRDYLAEGYNKIRDEIKEMSQTQAQQLFDNRNQMLKKWSDSGGLKKVAEDQYQMPFAGNKVEVFKGKSNFVSVDHKSQSVVLDTIGKGASEIKVQITELQKKYPEYSVLHRDTKADGFSVTTVVAPDGASSTFYSVPTHSRVSVSSVGSR